MEEQIADFYVVLQIIADYATSSEVKNLVDSYDLHIIPIVNPDGYKYTWAPNGVSTTSYGSHLIV